MSLLAAALLFGALWLFVTLGVGSLSRRVETRQARWLELSVKRSAVQCYVIEGRFPTSEQGVQYLADNYGLAIDSRRYVVYYESTGDNLLPLVKVFIIPQSSMTDEVNGLLGLGKGE